MIGPIHGSQLSHTHRHRTIHILYIALFYQDLSRLEAQVFDLLFRNGLTPLELLDLPRWFDNPSANVSSGKTLPCDQVHSLIQVTHFQAKCC